MKTTVKVSIGRIAFHVDSDAHQRLKNYLDRLETHFANKESGKEIVSDIEERLSELLTARLSQSEQVVTRAMVEEVIAVMGMPDDMEDSAPTDETAQSELAATPLPRYKRLYRDMEHKVLGGVCSGLAAYLNTDAVFVRLVFILFFFGFFIFRHAVGGTALLVYIILWIATPEARTAKEKLEMRGSHSPTIAVIERKMLAAAESSRDSGFVRVLKAIIRICVVFFGIILLIVAFFGFILLPLLLFVFDFVPNITVMELLNYVNISTHTFLFKLFLTSVLFLPFMGLVYIAVKALMGFRGKYKIGLIIFLLWIAAVIGLAVVALPTLRTYAHWTKVQEEVVLEHHHDTLYINVADKYKNRRNQIIVDARATNYFSALWSADSAGVTSFYLLPDVEIVHTADSGNIRIVYTLRAAGRSRYMAEEKLEQLLPCAFLRDSLLLLEPFIFDKENKWSGEFVRVRIYVPRGKEVKFKMLDEYRGVFNFGFRRNRYWHW